MKLYRVKNWKKIYENNRSRELKEIDWVVIPNDLSGDGYTMIIERPNGAAIYGAWCAFIILASRCIPRGVLVRKNGLPHDAESISRLTRMDKGLIQQMIAIVTDELHWVEAKEVEGQCEFTAFGCEILGEVPENSVDRYKQDQLRSAACRLINLLNLLTGSEFREVDSNLIAIMARLSEEGVTEQGCVTMITRQVELWTGNRMQQYLRPLTLFAKGKFDGYYAAKDLPVPRYENANDRNSIMGQSAEETEERGARTKEIVSRRMGGSVAADQSVSLEAG